MAMPAIVATNIHINNLREQEARNKAECLSRHPVSQTASASSASTQASANPAPQACVTESAELSWVVVLCVTLVVSLGIAAIVDTFRDRSKSETYRRPNY